MQVLSHDFVSWWFCTQIRMVQHVHDMQGTELSEKRWAEFRQSGALEREARRRGLTVDDWY